MTSKDPVCSTVFDDDRLNLDSARESSVEDLVKLEKCGFSYHPSISFYEEIVFNKNNPISSLLKELEASSDEHWMKHLVYLIKESVESDRFTEDVKREHGRIIGTIDQAQGKMKKQELVDQVRSDNDAIKMHLYEKGIEIY